MSTLLDLPEVHSRVMRLTVEKYERLAELGIVSRKAELLRGIIVERMPKTPLHRELSKRLYDLFHKTLPHGFTIYQGTPLRLTDSEPEPDISVVQGAEEDFRQRHPTTAFLVVEVAVSSAALDRAKASLYAEAGIQEYWIVLGLEQKVEVYRLTAANEYGEGFLVESGATLLCSAVPGLALSVGDLFL